MQAAVSVSDALAAERRRMNSFMSWVGGKKSLRDKIIIRFPLNYGRYIEVFGGAGWVLFHKTPEKPLQKQSNLLS